MEPQNLIVFNKAGLPINATWSEADQKWSAKAFFEKNSTDTFKDLAIYVMELVPAASIEATVAASRYRLYNEAGMFYKSGGYSTAITAITRTVVDSNFYTKWFEVEDGKVFNVGDQVYISGLTGDYSETSGGDTVLHTILAIRGNLVMLQIGLSNDNALPSMTFSSSTTLTSVNSIGFTIPSSPAWAEPGYKTDNFVGKVLVDSSTGYDYSVDRLTALMAQATHVTDLSSLSVTGDNKLALEIITYLARPRVYTGDMEFDSADSSLYFSDGLPALIAVGSEIEVLESASNTGTLTVTAISKVNRKAYFASVTDETLTGSVELMTNRFTFVIDQVNDRSNAYSDALTAAALVQEAQEEAVALGLSVSYDGTIISVKDNRPRNPSMPSLISVTAKRIDAATGDILETTADSSSDDDCYIYSLSEDTGDAAFNPDSSAYLATLAVDSLDSEGITLRIYGTEYSQAFDTDPATTLANFVTTHGTALSAVGLDVAATTYPASSLDILTITGQTPEVRDPQITYNVGGAAVCYFLHKGFDVSNIHDSLTITINGIAYSQPFNTDVNTTVSDWFDSYAGFVERDGYIALEGLSDNIVIGTKGGATEAADMTVGVKMGLSYLAGEYEQSVSERALSATPAGTCVAGDVVTFSGYDLIDYGFSSGMSVVISGFTKTWQNTSYSVMGITSDSLMVYAAAQFADFAGTVSVTSTEHVRRPRRGYSSEGASALIVELEPDEYSEDEMFLFDFSGEQSPVGQLQYTGPKPLLSDGSGYLNRLPNKDVSKTSDPLSQQTVFSELAFTLENVDDADVPENDAEPIQIFAGYKSENEGYHHSTLNISYLDPVSMVIETNASNGDDTVTFTTGFIEISNPSVSFTQNNIKVGQHIQVYGSDNYGDNRQLAILSNNGNIYRVESVQTYKLGVTLIEGTHKDETSIKTVTKPTPPYADANGNPYTQDRGITVTISAVKTPLISVQLYGETEAEDVRLRVALANVGRDITRADATILQSWPEQENGVNWPEMNRLRKDMLEAQFEIYGNPGSYASLDAGLNFWGYRDLILSEYYMNTDENSHRFGELMPIDIKDASGWQSKPKVPASHMKTNIFSLGVNLTDEEGYYIVDDFGTLAKKLDRLKNWLQTKVVTNARLQDISGRIRNKQALTTKFHTQYKEGIIATSANYPVTCTVDGYVHPVTPGSDFYDMVISFSTNGNTPDHMAVRVRTFALDVWNAGTLYADGSYTYRSGIVWKCLVTNKNNDPSLPGSELYWEPATDWELTPVQIIDVDRFSDLSDLTVTVNKTVDPHMQVEIVVYNGYGGSWLERSLWSLDTGQWPS